MDIVDELRVFVATAQTGSFTSAGRQLGMSNRLTSKYVAELEDRLGVRLFQRTTRKVGLTPAGEDLLARAPALLDDLDDLLTDLTEGSKGFSGVIRISAPVTFGEIYVAGMLGRFASRNPQLTLDLRLDDHFVDLAAEGIDLAFRIGTTGTLSIKTLKLGALESCLAASPRYIEQHGRPEVPEDLVQHACIIDTNRRNASRWVFHVQGKPLSVNVPSRFRVNSARAAAALATMDQGIIYAPRFAVSEALRTGRLVTLLDGFVGEKIPVSAVYLEGRVLPRKVRALIDFAHADIGSADVL